MPGKTSVNGRRDDPIFGPDGVNIAWGESDMDCRFFSDERRPATVLLTRPVAKARMTDEDRARVIEAVIVALDPFPEARMAVVAALEAAEDGSGRLE